jgi:MFS family permease
MTAGISLLSDPVHIAIGLFMIGVFAAIYHPVGIAMVSQGGGQVGKRLGVNGVWGNMGVALAAPVAWGLAEFGGWQTAFLVCGAVSVAIGIAWMLYLRGEAGRAEVAHGQAVRKKKTEPAANWKQVLIVVAIATAFGGFIFNSTTVALPKVFDERVMAVAENATQAGGLVAAVFAVAAFTQVLVGYLIDRYSIKMVFLTLSVADIAIFVIASSATGSLMFATALAMMAMVFGQIPITDTLVARNTPEAWRARVYSVKYVISFVVAATVVPSIAYLHEFAEGFTDLFMICAVCATVISLAVLMLPSAKPAVAEAAGDD